MIKVDPFDQSARMIRAYGAAWHAGLSVAQVMSRAFIQNQMAFMGLTRPPSLCGPAPRRAKSGAVSALPGTVRPKHPPKAALAVAPAAKNGAARTPTLRGA